MLFARQGTLVFLTMGVLSMPTFASTSATCEDGRAAEHPCRGVHMSSKLDLKTSGITTDRANDIWGWTDPETNREYALVGMGNKTAFVDVTDPEAPQHVGDLPTATYASIWRDVKVYANHAFIVSEASAHGMQVFDLTRLRISVDEPVEFDADAHYTYFGSAHNIVINEETGFAYSVGSDTCDAGMHVVDIRNPTDPVFATCVDKRIFENVTVAKHGEDYTHDAQCVVYNGPDEEYVGQEICVCSNADTVNIVNMTNKSGPYQISVKDYDGLGYTHQGWLTEDHRYFFLGDELDETNYGHTTKTLIWDLADLDQPVLVGTYSSDQKAIDHNMYVRGNLLYQANYDAGLRILDISGVAEANLVEVGYFDTVPESDKAEFLGAWSVYPYFESNTVVVSNIDGYLYVLKPSAEVLARQ